MSNVPVTEDRFTERRHKTLLQERNIGREALFTQWQRSDATKTLMIERLIGIAVVPFVMFWIVLFAAFSIGVGACAFVFRVLGGKKATIE